MRVAVFGIIALVVFTTSSIAQQVPPIRAMNECIIEGFGDDIDDLMERLRACCGGGHGQFRSSFDDPICREVRCISFPLQTQPTMLFEWCHACMWTDCKMGYECVCKHDSHPICIPEDVGY